MDHDPVNIVNIDECDCKIKKIVDGHCMNPQCNAQFSVIAGSQAILKNHLNMKIRKTEKDLGKTFKNLEHNLQ